MNYYPFYKNTTQLNFQAYTDSFSKCPSNINYKSSSIDIGSQCRSNYKIITPTVTISSDGSVLFNGIAPANYSEIVNIPFGCTNANIMVIGSGGGGGPSGGDGAPDGSNGSGGTFATFNCPFLNLETSLTVLIGKPGMGTSGSQGFPTLNYFESNPPATANSTTIISNLRTIATILGGINGNIGIHTGMTGTSGSEPRTTTPTDSSLYSGLTFTNLQPSSSVSINQTTSYSGNISLSTSSYPLNLLQNSIFKLNDSGTGSQYPINIYPDYTGLLPLFFGSNYTDSRIPPIKNTDGVVSSTIITNISYGSGGYSGKRYNSPYHYGYYGASSSNTGPGAAGAPGIVIIFWRYNII